MISQNGTDYAQNYDVIVKWLAAALRGETLEVLGIQTGRIEEVFGFEPVDIAVKAERVDVMVRDDRGAVYHIEEQRNLQQADLYRFAAYYFAGAQQWGANLTDLILASGEVYGGAKSLTLPCGSYTPVVIDFSARDGRTRLAEIRAAVQAGSFDRWLELAFLPLYGREQKRQRREFAEQVLHFAGELYRGGKISARLVAATLIMSNKLLTKEQLRTIWEEINMLDILEIAKEEGMKEGMEKGLQEGKTLGLQEGKMLGRQEGGMETTRTLLLEALIERFNVISARIAEQIRTLQNPDVLKGLFRQALKCHSLQEFEATLQQII